ncbi:MAG: type VI secretion system contractile sheath large subunit [Nitrospirae bacterium]|nr:type VI secretion system contractile sheath large subunit [Nitrospirota bacterium]
MPEPISFGKIDVSLTSTMEEIRGTVESDTPFRIAILGDFSGRVNRKIIKTGPALANRRFLPVDRDNIDDVLKKLGAEISLQILGKDSPPVIVKFSNMDDFHPDRLFENLDVFQALKETRQGLKDPAAFALLAKAFKQEETSGKEKQDTPLESPLAKGEIEEGSTGGLLDQILEEAGEQKPGAQPTQGMSEMDSFLREIVKPHLVPDIEKEQAGMIAAVDAAAGELMNMILHHPDFQAMEAAWRALHFLISRVDTDTSLKIYLFDISKEELAADLLSEAEDLRSSAMYKLLVEQTVEIFGGGPWAVIAGSYTFDRTIEDAELLGRMAKIAGRAGAPFISAAHPHLAGCESLAETPRPDDWKWSADGKSEEAWQALRKLPEASYAGLALPGFLLRLPYGVEAEPAESFNFEEMSGKPDHGHYLWGNPSFACLCLLAQSFSDYGWEFQPGVEQNIDGLPLHIYKEDGEAKIKPCAEVLFTEHAVDVILEKGIMPLISFKDQDIIRLARFQSIADPLAGLTGRWE